MCTNLINYADDIELYIPCENIDESILQTISLLERCLPVWRDRIRR